MSALVLKQSKKENKNVVVSASTDFIPTIGILQGSNNPELRKKDKDGNKLHQEGTLFCYGKKKNYGTELVCVAVTSRFVIEATNIAKDDYETSLFMAADEDWEEGKRKLDFYKKYPLDKFKYKKYVQALIYIPEDNMFKKLSGKGRCAEGTDNLIDKSVRDGNFNVCVIKTREVETKKFNWFELDAESTGKVQTWDGTNAQKMVDLFEDVEGKLNEKEEDKSGEALQGTDRVR